MTESTIINWQVCAGAAAGDRARPRLGGGAGAGHGAAQVQVRYCTVLYSTVQYSTVLHFTVLHCVRMMYAGNLMMSYQPLDDKPNFFRSIISNQAVTEEDVEFMLEEMDRLGIDL